MSEHQDLWHNWWQVSPSDLLSLTRKTSLMGNAELNCRVRGGWRLSNHFQNSHFKSECQIFSGFNKLHPQKPLHLGWFICKITFMWMNVFPYNLLQRKESVSPWKKMSEGECLLLLVLDRFFFHLEGITFKWWWQFFLVKAIPRINGSLLPN